MLSAASSGPRELLISGVSVWFPFTPYDTQIRVMTAIINALLNNTNVLIDAPTGSGKSLAILCATLAWAHHDEQQQAAYLAHQQQHQQQVAAGDEEAATVVPRRVVLLARTHAQLQQLARELERLQDGPPHFRNARAVLLAAREHLCVSSVAREAARRAGHTLGLECARRVSPAALAPCGPHARASSLAQLLRADPPLAAAAQMGPLLEAGRAHQACPLFAARELADGARLLLCPYAYVLDGEARRSSGLDRLLYGAAVVLDEAHNVPAAARAAASVALPASSLAIAVRELQPLAAAYLPLLLAAQPLAEWLASCRPPASALTFGLHLAVLSPSEVRQAFDPLVRQLSALLAALEQAEELQLQVPPGVPFADYGALSPRTTAALRRLLRAAALLSADDWAAQDRYRVVLHSDEHPSAELAHDAHDALDVPDSDNLAQHGPVLNVWCMHAVSAFADLSDRVQSLVLTSGSLAPLSPVAAELGLVPEACIQLMAPHVLTNPTKQLWLAPVRASASGQLLNFSYQHSDSLNMHDELGLTLVSLVEKIPNGVLCFFSSYPLLQKLVARWRNTGTFREFLLRKAVVCVEERGASQEQLAEQMDKYRQAAASGGALFLAVMRGRVSEGMDFKDHEARGTLIVGIPFPAVKEPKVVLKREYNDAASSSFKLQKGAAWYEAEAFRAVSQAIGRCLRHASDWGAVALLDERFADARVRNLLPPWMSKLLQPAFADFDQALASLHIFVTAAISASGPPKRPHLSVVYEETSRSSADGLFSAKPLPATKRWKGAAPARPASGPQSDS